MDTIIKFPGLKHISEDIFKLLDTKSLMNCRSTNSSWKNVLAQSIFWLQKMEMEGCKALTKHIGDRHLAKDFARDMLQQEFSKNKYLMTYFPTILQSNWSALLQELQNDHQTKEFVLILIKIYNRVARFAKVLQQPKKTFVPRNCSVLERNILIW